LCSRATGGAEIAGIGLVPAPVSAARPTAGAIPRTAALIWRMCSGVVPQQPPTTRTLCMMNRLAYDAMYSGEQR